MVACQDEKNFVNAKKFQPERWLDKNQNEFNMNLGGAGASIVLPFGIGKRTCPGKKYIEMELSLVVAKVRLGLFQSKTFNYSEMSYSS